MEVTVDAVAEIIYGSRPRSIAWADLSEVGWKAEYRRAAQAVLDGLGLSVEFTRAADGAGGISSHTDSAGRVVSTTTSGRTQTELRRYVTRWEVSRAAQEYSHTTHHDPPVTYTVTN